MYALKKRESKLFMMITIEVTMIQTDSHKKSSYHQYKPDTCQCEVVEELIARMAKRLLDIEHTSDICRYLQKRRDIKYPSMYTVEDNEEDEIHEWKCEHVMSIGISEGNSRE